MQIPLAVVKTLEDFIARIVAIKSEWFQDDPFLPWFRGQERATWPLLPKLYREKRSNQLETESEIREEFCTRAPALSDYSRLGSNGELSNWEWYFVMQHYGAPTRLLDWSESALIALYFALKSNKGDFDAAVWVLDPWWVNKLVIDTDAVIPPADPGTLQKDRDNVAPWLPGRFKKGAKVPDFPVAVLPTHTIRRVSAQRSCFTIHGSKYDGLEALVAKEKKKSHLLRIEVPSWAVNQVKQSLNACGIDETTIFPDLEALGRAVTLNWKDKTSIPPHSDVDTRLGQSKIHGVGVFAIRHIKKGTPLFGNDDGGVIWIKKSATAKVDRESKRLYEDFAVVKNGQYGCPPSFNRLTPAWYLNESKTPNVLSGKDYRFYAGRDIRKGEELTVDYSTYSEDQN
jgi:FRG domain-containing protein/SET domain-containing protein